MKARVLVFFSISVITTGTRNNLGWTKLFIFYNQHSFSKGIQGRSSSNNLEVGTKAEVTESWRTAFFLWFTSFSCLSFPRSPAHEWPCPLLGRHFHINYWLKKDLINNVAHRTVWWRHFLNWDSSHKILVCVKMKEKKVKPNQHNCLYLSIMHISELIHLEVETKFSKRQTLAMFTKEEKGESVSAWNAKTL